MAMAKCPAKQPWEEKFILTQILKNYNPSYGGKCRNRCLHDGRSMLVLFILTISFMGSRDKPKSKTGLQTTRPRPTDPLLPVRFYRLKQSPKANFLDSFLLFYFLSFSLFLISLSLKSSCCCQYVCSQCMAIHWSMGILTMTTCPK